MTTETWAKDHEIKGKNGTLIFLQVQPGASKNQIRGLFASNPPRLKIAIQAPPVEGAANEAVTEFLADTLKISQSKIHLLQGATSRQKNFWIEGLSSTQCLQRLTPEYSS